MPAAPGLLSRIFPSQAKTIGRLRLIRIKESGELEASAPRNERFDLGRRPHAGKARDLFATAKDRECRNREDAEAFSQLRDTVGVDFDHEGAASHVPCGGLELRRHHAARTAPRRPEVDDHRDRRALNDRVKRGDVGCFNRLGGGRQRCATAPASDRAIEVRVPQAVRLAARRTPGKYSLTIGMQSRHI